jgi:hypoxanthine phosphoribosyltransferase
MTSRNIIVSKTQLDSRVRELGEHITQDYDRRHLDVVCLINGGSMFCADIVRHIQVPITQHYLGFSSYPEGNSSGEVRITLDIAEPLQGRHLLLVEGIVVSGRTPAYLVELLKLRQPASIALCALGVKPNLSVDLSIEYVAFKLGKEIAMGYGIGNGPERTLPYLVESS